MKTPEVATDRGGLDSELFGELFGEKLRGIQMETRGKIIELFQIPQGEMEEGGNKWANEVVENIESKGIEDNIGIAPNNFAQHLSEECIERKIESLGEVEAMTELTPYFLNMIARLKTGQRRAIAAIGLSYDLPTLAEVSELTNMHSPQTKRELDELDKKGLVKYIKIWKKKYYMIGIKALKLFFVFRYDKNFGEKVLNGEIDLKEDKTPISNFIEKNDKMTPILDFTKRQISISKNKRKIKKMFRLGTNVKIEDEIECTEKSMTFSLITSDKKRAKVTFDK